MSVIPTEYLSQTTSSTPPPAGGPIPGEQVAVALTLAITMLVIVVELVRRKKLREEYAVLWIGTAVVLLILALDTSILGWLSTLARAQSPVSILFFGANVFLMLIALQFSVHLTKLTFRSKTLSQKVALLERQLRDLEQRLDHQENPQSRPEKDPLP